MSDVRVESGDVMFAATLARVVPLAVFVAVEQCVRVRARVVAWCDAEARCASIHVEGLLVCAPENDVLAAAGFVAQPTPTNRLRWLHQTIWQSIPGLGKCVGCDAAACVAALSGPFFCLRCWHALRLLARTP